jgi:hypothetical protein
LCPSIDEGHVCGGTLKHPSPQACPARTVG